MGIHRVVVTEIISATTQRQVIICLIVDADSGPEVTGDSQQNTLPYASAVPSKVVLEYNQQRVVVS